MKLSLSFFKSRKAQVAGNIFLKVFYFLIFVIVFMAISYGFGIFYGDEYDFRKIDAQSLNYKIINCLEEADINFRSPGFEDEFLSTCNINRKVVEENLLLIIQSEDDEILFKLGTGDETQCGLSEKNPNFPKCAISTKNVNGEEIVIITGSNQKREERLA